MNNKVLNKKTIRYVLNHLLSIALPKKNHSFSFILFKDKVEVIISSLNGKKIIFRLMSTNQIELLLKHNLIFEQILSFDFRINIPVFYVTNRNEFSSILNDTLQINVDIITLSFILMSRYEEKLIKTRDKYGRFEYNNSLSCHYNFIDIPIIDEYAMLLRKSLQQLFPGLQVEKRIGKIIPTHDIDDMFRFGNFFRNIKTIIGGDIILRKSLLTAFLSFLKVIMIPLHKSRDPYVKAIEKLVEVSSQNGICSEFYFKGLKTDEGDCTYDINIPDVKYCIDVITHANMVVGMHGGLDSASNEEVFKREKIRIENVLGERVISGRQHFLMFNYEKTIQIWQNSGIKYDSTFGHFEREGFQSGTCHEYYLYDLKNDKVSTVIERPLIAMDTSLFVYRKQKNKAALKTLNKLYNRCQAVEGDFIILWHNMYVLGFYKKRFNEVYCNFFQNIMTNKVNSFAD